MKTGFENYHTDALAWWVWHMDNDGCERCPDGTSPEVAERVRAEWATRSQVLPRHLRDGRFDRIR
jgi:hypothetical protein